jgi:hypothetical protein
MLQKVVAATSMRALAQLNALRIISSLPVARLYVPFTQGVLRGHNISEDITGIRAAYSTMASSASADDGKAFHDPSTGQLGSKAPAEDTVLDSAAEVANVAEEKLDLGPSDGKAAAGPSAPAKAEKVDTETALPPLTPHEFKQYNRLAEHMNYFVSRYRILSLTALN